MPMSLSELIAAVGNENVGLQNLDQCGVDINYHINTGIRITFVTPEKLSHNLDGMERLGLVVWLPRDAVDAAVKAGPGPTATALKERIKELEDVLGPLVEAVGAMRVPQTLADAALQVHFTVGPVFLRAKAVLEKGVS